MRRRPRTLAAAAVVVMVALGGLAAIISTRSSTPSPLVRAEPLDTEALALDTPLRIDAGTDLAVTVTTSDPAHDEVLVVVESPYSTRERRETIDAGSASVTFPAESHASGGTLTVTAIADRSVATQNVIVSPAEAVDPLELFLGPRTIEATAAHATMIVVVAQDRFGNPVASGTPVDVAITRPDGARQSLGLEIDRLLAWSRIVSGTLAGRSRAAATVGAARGDELEFLEIAGVPEPFSLTTVDPAPPADGRSLIRVVTDRLIDVFGNPMPDGIDAYADVDGPGGRRQLRSQVIAGRAEFTIEAPARPGTETVTITVSGTTGDPLTVTFAPMVEAFPVAIDTTEAGHRVTIGPIVSTLDAYVADGTVVTARIDDQTFLAPTFDGTAIIEVNDDGRDVFEISVEVLGATKTLTVGQ